ncbi:MAG: hypothetical protein QGH90_04340 [Candidatus Poseidoniaceae archaeon]|nr:hypothetical protein [Candidatus Poseidoniaceae archaeon]
MKNLDEWLAATTPFHTFESCDVAKLNLVLAAITEAPDPQSEALTEMLKHPEISERLESQGITDITGRDDISWDNATLAWLCSLPNNSGLPKPLGSDKARERLGRYSWGDGNPLSYLSEFITPLDDGEELLASIDLLANRFAAKNVGHDEFRTGSGGMCLLGYQSVDEANELRRLLTKGKWAVSSEEIYDGGVREIAKHLIVVLRQATSKGWGVLLRAHK